MDKHRLGQVRGGEARRGGCLTPHQEISKAAIGLLADKPRTGKDEYLQDTEIPGFRLRKTPSGTILFLFTGRIRNGQGTNKNKLIKRTIGLAFGQGAMAVSKARVEAQALRDAIAKGVDPADELRAKAEASEAAKRKQDEALKLREWTPAFALDHMLQWRAAK